MEGAVLVYTVSCAAQFQAISLHHFWWWYNSRRYDTLLRYTLTVVVAKAMNME